MMLIVIVMTITVLKMILFLVKLSVTHDSHSNLQHSLLEARPI